MVPTREMIREMLTERTSDWLETFYVAWLNEARELKDAPVPYGRADRVEARKAYAALLKAWEERK